jgi:hypothetical protein
MRIRTVKPEFWKNEHLGKLSDKTRLLALALLNYADDEGYFNANPEIIRGELFPFDKDSRSLQVGLTELSQLGYLRLSQAGDGRTYGWIVKFKVHQKVNNPSSSKIKPLASFTEDSGNLTLGLPEPYLLEQGTGNREAEHDSGREPGKNGSSDADEIYGAYPRKVEPRAAHKAIVAAMKLKPAAHLLDRTKAFAAATAEWPPEERKFIPYPASWFNSGGYDSDPETWKRVKTSTAGRAGWL